MFRSILVPLDGSMAAEHALPMALSLTRRFGAALTIIHVHAPTWTMLGEGGLYGARVNVDLREAMQAYLNGVVQRTAVDADVSIKSIIREGVAPDTLRRYAENSDIDLVVMATHGHGPVARFWLGSVSDALVREASIPILFVRPQEAKVDLARELAIERMLITLDGSDLAEQILAPATAIAAAMQAKVTLLRVIQQWAPDRFVPSGSEVIGVHLELQKQLQEADQQERTRTDEYHRQLEERLQALSLNVQSRVVSHLQPAAAILDEAAAMDADLIAMATHGRGGLKRLMLGSVADKVLRGAAKPVLVYRPAGDA